MSRRSSRSNSIDSDISRKNSIDSRSYSFDNLSIDSGKMSSNNSFETIEEANTKKPLFIPIKNNKKHKRREREQSTDNIVSKSPSIQNVIKYLQIFEHQRKETKSNE